MKIPIILVLFLSIPIKSEIWYDAVSGANVNDGKHGYAGSRGVALTHFYLCGNRRYRVHYLGDPRDQWTGQYWGCDPVGNGRPIDGISISGGKGYRVRLKNGGWKKMVYGYNINDYIHGMAGEYNKEIDAILVEGGDSYRAAYGPSTSLIEIVASKISNNLFGVSKELNFERNLFIYENDKVKVFGKLLHKIKVELEEGIIKLTIKENKVVKSDWSGLFPENVYKILKQMIDVYKFQSNFESKITAGMVNGDVSVKSFWKEKKIEINVGVKITPDHWSYRAGVKYIIFMKDDHDDYKRSTKKYIVYIPNFNWDNFFNFLNNHYNPNSVGNSIYAGIIATSILVAFHFILFV